MTDSARRDDLNRFPILGQLSAGERQTHQVVLPGALLREEPRPVVSIAGANPGPVVFINAGVHGGEYPAIETAIQLGKTLDPATLSGTVVIMPVLNLPAFWKRSMFVCPIDDVNPNRVFPGDPEGSYSEQMVYALTTEFMARADCYIDLHGGDMVEGLVPFSICRTGAEDVDQKSLELAKVFGLPYLLTVDRPIQPSKGSMSFVAGAERGVPGFIAEAGGVGQLQLDAVDLLTNGIRRVLKHLSMIDADVPEAAASTVLTNFEWLYSENAGMFYPSVAINEEIVEGQRIGHIGSLFGEQLEEIHAPLSGRILFITTSPAVLAHGLLMGIGA
ncbi:MAG TPA: succinylglutamate desuccinylase/aspartoacylase family protein [Nitrolancea sp.]